MREPAQKAKKKDSLIGHFRRCTKDTEEQLRGLPMLHFPGNQNLGGRGGGDNAIRSEERRRERGRGKEA